jgi:FtsZ-binding cell division protein ZapB
MAKAGLAGIGLLEDKITKAAELIERLRMEKREIEETNKTLEDKIESLYIKNEELTKELKNFKAKGKSKKDSKKTREEINTKIEEMLAKLEGLKL